MTDKQKGKERQTYVRTQPNNLDKNKLSTKEYLELLDKLCTIPGRKHQ